jgi:hypothetical protein
VADHADDESKRQLVHGSSSHRRVPSLALRHLPGFVDPSAALAAAVLQVAAVAGPQYCSEAVVHAVVEGEVVVLAPASALLQCLGVLCHF